MPREVVFSCFTLWHTPLPPFFSDGCSRLTTSFTSSTASGSVIVRSFLLSQHPVVADVGWITATLTSPAPLSPHRIACRQPPSFLLGCGGDHPEADSVARLCGAGTQRHPQPDIHGARHLDRFLAPLFDRQALPQWCALSRVWRWTGAGGLRESLCT